MQVDFHILTVSIATDVTVFNYSVRKVGTRITLNVAKCFRGHHSYVIYLHVEALTFP